MLRNAHEIRTRAVELLVVVIHPPPKVVLRTFNLFVRDELRNISVVTINPVWRRYENIYITHRGQWCGPNAVGRAGTVLVCMSRVALTRMMITRVSSHKKKTSTHQPQTRSERVNRERRNPAGGQKKEVRVLSCEAANGTSFEIGVRVM